VIASDVFSYTWFTKQDDIALLTDTLLALYVDILEAEFIAVLAVR
jgi:hypothetical protein